jgi:monoamine oxidase/SAM-dependent methyltransferase
MKRIGVVGGGPGGLITASMLESFCRGFCDLTVFEISDRIGGKISTKKFGQYPVPYEAGVAEFYGYSHLGPDPLKELILSLGLGVKEIQGHAVLMGGHVLASHDDIELKYGKGTLHALKDFYNKCRMLLSPAQYYEGHFEDDNTHPWSAMSFKKVLDEVPDEFARKYIVTASMSDVATEAHLTSALDGLKNVLMDDPSYLTLYSIVGGNEQLPHKLAEKLLTTVFRLNSEAKKVSRNNDGSLRLTVRCNGKIEEHDFDALVLALPNYWLERLEWGSRDLRIAMENHLSHYANPAHYLRISVLFKKPFWREVVPGDFFMSDAFGGCGVYDEGSRLACDPYGVLGWLIAGNQAMALANLDDEILVKMALDSLPPVLSAGHGLKIEGRVHRWIGTINGLPGGHPVRTLHQRHVPEPVNHEGLLLVGDYLFDSTLNGVYDSADYVTDLLLTRLRKTIYAGQLEMTDGRPSRSAEEAIDADYFDSYSGDSSYDESFEEMFSAPYTVGMIGAVWGAGPPYKLLDCGSASGLTLREFEKCGVEAWGVENCPHIHSKTPQEWLGRNILGDVLQLPFEDNSFDYIYDTCLCYLPEEMLDKAIQELARVCRVGVIYMGVVTDMTKEVIEDYELFYGVKTFRTQWGWSEAFLKNGFKLAIEDPSVLKEVWRIEQESGEDDWDWYPDKECMRFCFYSKPDVSPRRLSPTSARSILPLTPMHLLQNET